jgi:hypothetical protein
MRLDPPNRFSRKNSTIVPQSYHVFELISLANGTIAADATATA